MDPYSQIIKTWDTLAEAYEKKFMGLSDYNVSYDLFLAALRSEKAELLEIACGPGMISKYLLEKNPKLQITATDVSPSMLELAKKNCPNVKTLQLDSRNLDQIKNKFDGIVCGFVLPYLTKEDFKKFFSEVSLHLVPNGVFYVSAIDGKYDQSGLVKSSDGQHEMMNYYYSESDLKKMLTENKLNLLHFLRIQQNKNDQLILIAQK